MPAFRAPGAVCHLVSAARPGLRRVWPQGAKAAAAHRSAWQEEGRLQRKDSSHPKALRREGGDLCAHPLGQGLS